MHLSISSWPLSTRPYWPTEQWHSRPPRASGVDEQRLTAVIDYGRSHLPNLQSLLVVHQGYIISEYYYPGSDHRRVQRLHSATNSVTTALLGVVLARRALRNLDQPLHTLLPSTEPARRAITLRHLLTMTSGIGRTDHQPDWPLDARWSPQTDDITAALTEPLVARPGTRFQYATPATQLFAPILRALVKMDIAAFAATSLFEPLGIRNWSWQRDPHGYPIMGHGLALAARDLAKIGYLYLNRGLWADKRILPAAYVVASTRPQHSGGWPMYVPYGYLWWVTEIRGQAAFYAAGHGEQYVYIIPGLDTVIVLTGDDAVEARDYQGHRALIEEWIVPILADSTISKAR